MIKKNKKSLLDKVYTKLFLILLSSFFLTSLTYKLNLAAYFAIVPLLLIIYKKNLKTTILSCMLAGLVASLFTFDWVYRYTDYLYPIVILVFTFFFTLFGALTHFLYRKMKYLPLLAAPSVWVWLMLLLDFTKYGSYIFEFSMYNSLTAPLIWLIGGRGITFVVILLNSVIAGVIIKKTKWRILGVIGILIVLMSCYVYSNLAESSGEVLDIALVQGNFDQSWEWRQENVVEILDTYENLSRLGKDKHLIIWPEHTIPIDITLHPWLFERLQYVVKENNAYFIIGSIIYDKHTEDHYDSALLFNPKGEMTDVYDSVYPAFYNEHTIPGGEDIKLFDIGEKKAGIMICAEEKNSKLARLQSKNGAQLLISISNDQDLGRGIYLSSLYSRLRAAENYKYFIRATNTGITQIINPYGKSYKIDENKRNILIGEIRLNEHKSLYTHYGDIPLYIITFFVVILFKKREFK